MYYITFSNIFYELFLNIFPKPFSYRYIEYEIQIIFILFIVMYFNSSVLIKFIVSFFIYPSMILLSFYIKNIYLQKWSPIMKIIDNNGEKIRFKAICGFNPLDIFDIKISYIEYKIKLKKIVNVNKRKILNKFKKGHDYHIRFNNYADIIHVTLVCPEIYTKNRLMFDV